MTSARAAFPQVVERRHGARWARTGKSLCPSTAAVVEIFDIGNVLAVPRNRTAQFF